MKRKINTSPSNPFQKWEMERPFQTYLQYQHYLIPTWHKNSTGRESYKPIPLVDIHTKLLDKDWKNKFNNTLLILYIKVKNLQHLLWGWFNIYKSISVIHHVKLSDNSYTKSSNPSIATSLLSLTKKEKTEHVILWEHGVNSRPSDPLGQVPITSNNLQCWRVIITGFLANSCHYWKIIIFVSLSYYKYSQNRIYNYFKNFKFDFSTTAMTLTPFSFFQSIPPQKRSEIRIKQGWRTVLKFELNNVYVTKFNTLFYYDKNNLWYSSLFINGGDYNVQNIYMIKW